MKLDGFYINLASSETRRADMEAQLAGIGYDTRIARFEAIDGARFGPYENRAHNGIWACRRSHEDVILGADPESATIVLEDDVEISRHFARVVHDDAIAFFVQQYPTCDVLFLDCCPFSNQIPAMLAQSELQMRHRAQDADEPLRHEPSGVSLLDAHALYAYCAAAYIVTPKGKQTLRRLFAAHEVKSVAIDTLYRDWIASREMVAQVSVPFLATPKYVNDSTIAYDELGHVNLPVHEGQLINAIRRLLFAGDADLDMNEIARIMREVRPSREYALGMQLYEAARTILPA